MSRARQPAGGSAAGGEPAGSGCGGDGAGEGRGAHLGGVGAGGLAPRTGSPAAGARHGGHPADGSPRRPRRPAARPRRDLRRPRGHRAQVGSAASRRRSRPGGAPSPALDRDLPRPGGQRPQGPRARLRGSVRGARRLSRRGRRAPPTISPNHPSCAAARSPTRSPERCWRRWAVASTSPVPRAARASPSRSRPPAADRRGSGVLHSIRKGSTLRSPASSR